MYICLTFKNDVKIKLCNLIFSLFVVRIQFPALLYFQLILSLWCVLKYSVYFFLGPDTESANSKERF